MWFEMLIAVPLDPFCVVSILCVVQCDELIPWIIVAGFFLATGGSNLRNNSAKQLRCSERVVGSGG